MDSAASAFERDLAASVNATLLVEARRNEATIAKVRVVALALVAVLDTLLWLQPPGFRLPYTFSPLNALLAAGWLGAALLLARRVRAGWFPGWLRLVLPLVDAAILLSLFGCILLTAGGRDDLLPAVVNSGIAAALLAVTGGVRLHAGGVWMATAAALASFGLIATWGGQALPETVFGMALLAGVGLMGRWVSDIVRRAVRSEVARVVLMRFLPREVVDGAHQSPLSLVTHPRRVEATVLVSDLRGFTSHAERLAPELVLELLNRVQSTLAGIVHAHGGRVDKFMGDGMLAVFGMDGAGAHARDALDAARRMRDAVAGLAPAGTDALRLGIGVHSGPLVAGCLGSGLRLEFTVLGDTVNTAARLQDATKDLGVDLLVSAATYHAAGAPAGWRALGEVALRGRLARQAVFAPA